MLPCLTGSWKEVGGGLQMSLSGSFGLDKASLERLDLIALASPLGRPARVINMNRLGKVLTETNDPPVMALFVYACNPAAVTPNHNLVVKGLQRKDLFTVVHEQFLYGYHRLCRYRPARDHLLRTQGLGSVLRPLLPPDIESGHPAARRV